MTLAPITASTEDAARDQLCERLLVFGYAQDEAASRTAAATREPSDADPHDFWLTGTLRGEVPFRVEVRVP